MTLPPWLVLSLVSALALALIYQVVTRRFGWRVLGYWIVILVGLLGGEMLAESMGWDLVRLGDLRVAADATGAMAAVVALRLFGV